MPGAVKWGSEFLVVEGGEFNLHTAGLANGEFVVWWETRFHTPGTPAPTTTEGTDGRLFHTDGSLETNVFGTASSLLVDTDPYSTMAALPDGRFIVAWSASGHSLVFITIYNADGSQSVRNGLSERWTDLSLAALPDNRSVLTFDLNRSNSREIFAQLLNSDASTSGSPFQVNPATTTDSVSNPSVITLADGRFVIGWGENVHGLGVISEQGQLFNSNGSASGSAFSIAPSSANIAALADGRFVAVWAADVSAADSDVHGQIFNADGTPSGAEFLVNTATNGAENEPAVIGLKDGRFMVAWTDSSHSDGDSSGTAIHAQLFNADGSDSGSELLVNSTTAGDQTEASLSELTDGRIIVAWRDSQGVEGQILDPREAAVNLTATASGEELAGTRFNDTLDGGAGNDRLDGGRPLASSNTFFGPWTQWQAGITPSDKLVDVNGDGKADLVQFFNGEALVALSDGSSFGPWTNWTSGTTPSDHFADVNGDGLTDLVQFYNGEAAVALSDGSSFGPWTNWIDGVTASDRLADVNGDGDADLVQFYNRNVAVALAAPSTHISPSIFEPWTQWQVGVKASDKLVDVNGDGKADLVQFQRGEVVVALADPSVRLSSHFESWTQWQVGITAKDKLVDVNGDGKADLVQFYNDQASVALSDGAHFGPWTQWQVGVTARDKLVDVNGDGKADLVQFYNGEALVALSDGSHFGPWTPGQTDVRASDKFADVNGDNRADLVQFNNGQVMATLSTSIPQGTDGNDTFTGAAGQDTFVFGPFFGQDHVTDFAPGVDSIQIDHTMFADFDTMLAHTADDGHGDAVITYDQNNTITLDHVLKAQLSASDFHFV